MLRMIKLRGDSFAFLDELAYFQQIYLPNFKPRDIFYRLHTPFHMDSQVKAAQKQANVKKRRKRKLQKNVPQLLLMNCAYVHDNYEKFLAAMNVASDSEIKSNHDDNNKSAREAAKAAPQIYRFQPDDNPSLECITIRNSSQPMNLHSPTLFVNGTKANISLRSSADGRNFILPVESTFINGDVRMLRHICHRELKYDFIVMDPPWPNKSIKRKKNYVIYDRANELEHLPIQNLLAENGLVCIWLPNNEKMQSITRTVLAEQWSLVELATWHWLKICQDYRPVVDFRPDHKVPYESLILASKGNSADIFNKISNLNNYTIISVPSANPSRKPPIGPILNELGLHSVCNGLEIFARYLLPKFFSIGNEAIKFQDSYFFEETFV